MHLTRSAVVATALILAACSGSSGNSGPAPVTRQTVPPVATDSPTDVFTPTGAGDENAGAVETSDTTAVTDVTATEPSTTTAPAADYSIVFEDLGGGVEGGWLTVPVDYDDPRGDSLKLWVTRRPSTSDDRVGVLFTNAGGPGVASSSVPLNAGAYFRDPLLEYFDIVSWDPRGTGVSGGSVDCIADDEYDRYFGSSDITPDDEAEREELVELSSDFADGCVDSVGDTITHIGTNNSARDMDAIRQALGETQASYLGFSYGSELGAVWASLFPDTVRAAVLDGAAHPDSNGTEPAKQQQLGFESAFNTFLAECSATPSCAFHNDGDAEGAYDRLMQDLDENPIPGADGRPLVNQEIAAGGVIQAMYSDRRWPALERSLADAAAGDGAGLLALYDSYNRRDPLDGSYGNLLESFLAITCADEPERLTVEEADARAEELIGVAPRVFPSTTGTYTCDFFPPSADPRAEITGVRAGPIVVIGTTGDPSTPLASSAAMADALEEGVLVTVEANRHLAYGQTNNCIDDVVHQYLIWLEPPAPDVTCT
ncbi:alpha/beta hydrolase [Ilumatobacter sp.]|uniref:alpha/beta hydrolase n=1 Tax=Ilumatobacter sp. TaxID=1967498 RepID=UPI003C6BA44D